MKNGYLRKIKRPFVLTSNIGQSLFRRDKTTKLRLGLRALLFIALLAVSAFKSGPPITVYAASITVNTTDDELNSDGDCSLREAITAANTNTAVDACPPGVPGADAITFSVIGTIILSSPLPPIGDHLSIIGPGEVNLIIGGNNSFSLFINEPSNSLSLENLTLTQGRSGIGAAVWSKPGSNLRLSHTTLSDNYSSIDGGAVYAQGTTIIENSIIDNNTAADLFGGGIVNYGSLTLIDSTVSNNRLTHTYFTSSGGGIFNRGTLNITGSTFTNNAVGCYVCVGGAIESRVGSLTVTNSTFTGNYASGGAAILVGSGTAVVVNSTFVNNPGKFNNGIVHYNGPFTIRNSILVNTPFGGSLGIADGGHNLEYPIRSYFGSSLLADPLLGPLQDNGGPTFTFALAAGSPAVDAVPLPNCLTITADQRGIARPQLAACDIGAYELANQPPTVDAGGPYSVNEGSFVPVMAVGNDPEGGPLTYAWDSDNDGVFETPGPSVTFSALLLDGPNSHTIAVQATDSGGLSATAQATVNIANVAPSATFNVPIAVDEGSAINLALLNPTDPSNADMAAGFTYAFDCGDSLGYGAFGVDNSASCSTSDNASRTVKGKIRDKDGGETEYSAALTINNVAPSVNAGPDATLTQGQTFSSSGSFSDPGADTWLATVDYGDGSGSQPLSLNLDKSFSLSHVYGTAGLYTLTVAISDDDGGIGSDTVVVTVLGPRRLTEDLIEKVRELVGQGLLNKGQGNALIVKLEAAIKQLDRGNTKTAINQLQAFINQVNAMIDSGTLLPEDGQPLIDAANEIIAIFGN